MASKQIQNLFQAQSNAIASYNWTDIAEGTGIVKFYGFGTTDNTGTNYALSENIFYADPHFSSASTTSTSYFKALDMDFDLTEFNTPKIVKGTVIIQAASKLDGSDATGESHYLIFKVRKVSGGSETDLGTVQTATIDSSTKKQYHCVKISVNRTFFKKGDILRVTIEGWAKVSSGTANLYVAHSPTNEDVSGQLVVGTDVESTQFVVYIPFGLEI